MHLAFSLGLEHNGFHYIGRFTYLSSRSVLHI